MPLTPRPPTRQTPHNKSDRAREAEARGEHTWTHWRLADLIQQVLRCNSNGVTEADLRQVRNLEYLKVKLLVPTAKHHTGLRMPEPVRLKQDQYFGLNGKMAAKLSPQTVTMWRENPPTPAELNQAVENLTGRRFYRKQ